DVGFERFTLDEPSRGWYIAALGMSLVIFVAFFLLLYGPRPRARAFATNTWFPALLGAGLSLSATQWILLLPACYVLLQSESHRFADPAERVVVGSTVILPLLSLLLVSIPTKKMGIQWNKGAQRWTTPAYAAVIALLFFWIFEQWYQANGGFLGT